MMSHFLRPGETLFLAFLPGWIAAAVIIFYFALVYLALCFFAFRRKYRLPFHFHVLCLLFAVLVVVSATLYSVPPGFKLPTFVFSTVAFLTCLLGAYLALAAVDLFITDYYLGTVRRVYISPPLRKLIRAVAFCVAAFVSMDVVFNFNPTTRLASLGVGGLAIGLALQNTLRGIIAGLSLGRLLRVGDWVQFKGVDGQVVDLNWGRLTLRTFEGNLLFIPNKELEEIGFLNYTIGQRRHRARLEVNVSYAASPEEVRSTLIAVAGESQGVLREPPPEASVLSFGDSGIRYGIFFWVDGYDKVQGVLDGVATRIWETFRRKGFEIPYPVRTVYLNPETVSQKSV